MTERMCIVTRQVLPTDMLLRFVIGPDNSLVPDIKQKLPGRGCWVIAQKKQVEEARKRNLFTRALEANVNVSDEIASQVEELLATTTLGMMNLATKAGEFITGSAKVDDAVRKGQAIATFHSTDAAADGVRKIDQARTFFSKMAEEDIIPSYQLFSSDEMAAANADKTIIHAAALAGKAGKSVVRRASALKRYKGECDGIIK